MKQSKLLKVLSLVLALCMVLILVTACGSRGGEKQPAAQDQSKASSDAAKNADQQKPTEKTAEKSTEKPITLTLLTRYSGADPQAPYLKEMMDLFKQKHPNVNFQDDSISEEAAYNNKLKTNIATGTIPNMFIIYGSAPLAEYAKNGILMDVSPLLQDKEWANGFIDSKFDYYNLEKYGVKGIYGIPFGYYPEVIWYNTELFKKAGITSKPETMDDLYAAIDKLKAIGIIPWGAGAKDTWRTGHIHNNLVYRAAGVGKMKDIGARTAKWTDADVVESLQVLKDLKAKGAFEKGLEGVDYETEKSLFFGEKSAMSCNGAWFIADIEKSPIKDKIDFFPFPYFKDKPQFKGDSVLFTNGHVFSGKLQGAEKEMTIEWAKFFHSKEAQQIRFDKHKQIPARKDVDTSKSDSKLLGQISQYMSTVTTPGGDYFDYDTLASMVDVSRNNIIGMLLGKTAKEAAEAIQKEIDKEKK